MVWGACVPGRHLERAPFRLSTEFTLPYFYIHNPETESCVTPPHATEYVKFALTTFGASFRGLKLTFS